MRDIDLLWSKFVNKTATDEEVEQLFAAIADENLRGAHIDYLDKLKFQIRSLQDYDHKYWDPFINRILREQYPLKKKEAWRFPDRFSPGRLAPLCRCNIDHCRTKPVLVDEQL